MNKIQTTILSNAVQAIHNYFSYVDRILVLEPFTCIIRLGMLAFKPIGTKICITENSIYLQEPGLLQGTFRWMSGDNRNDLHFLKEPITKAIGEYDLKNNTSIHYIFKLAVRGLRRLKLSYNSDTNSSLTSHSIDYYIKTLEDALESSPLPSQFIQASSSQQNHTHDVDMEDHEDPEDNKNTEHIQRTKGSKRSRHGEKANHTNHNNHTKRPTCTQHADSTALQRSFRQLWEPEQIDIIHSLFLQAEQNTEEKAYLEAIEQILSVKIKLSKEIILSGLKNIKF